MPDRTHRPAALAILLALSPLPASACFKSVDKPGCIDRSVSSVGGAGAWQKPPTDRLSAPDLRIGTVLADDEFSVLLGTGYLGLPPVRDNWVYVRIDHRIYRVDRTTRTVLAKVDR